MRRSRFSCHNRYVIAVRTHFNAFPLRRKTHPSSRKRAVAVVFSSYPADPRPRRAAEALVKEGMQVEVICLKETDREAMRESFNGVEITRIPFKHLSRRGGKLSYLAEYGLFVLLAGAILAVRSVRRRYDLVHVHNMPDFLVFSALVPRY